jgi:hypothetical protein
MTALPPVPKVVQVRMIGADDNDNEVGTHFDVSFSGAQPTVAEITSFADSIFGFWATYIAPLTPTDFSLKAVKCADLTGPTAAVGEYTGSSPGTRGSTFLPLSVAFTLQFQTLLRRRGGKWHAQLRVGIDSDLANAQTWENGFISTVIPAWEAFMSVVLGAGWAGAGSLAHVGIGYYGPPNRTITGSTGRVRTVSTLLEVPDIYPVVGYAAYNRLGSQRRRLGKSGT